MYIKASIKVSVFYTIIGVLFFISSPVYARNALRIRDDIYRAEALNKEVSIWEDTSGICSFQRILALEFPDTDYIITNNRNPKTAYWVKFDMLVEQDLKTKKTFEILDFKIDSFDLYLPNEQGGYQKYSGGDSYPFSYREVKHKNFLFELPYYKKGIYHGYIRVKANEVVGLNFAISDYKKNIEWTSNEYMVLSMFYGIILAIIMVSLFLYFYFGELSYLFYSIYSFSLAFYFLTRDGLGFEFLWPNYPIFNSICQPLSVYMIVIFHLLFIRYYFNKASYTSILTKLIWVIIPLFPFVAYAADVWAGLIPDPLMAILIVFIPLAVLSYKQALAGEIEMRFFAAAYTIQFIGFFIFTLAYLYIIETGVLVYYSINIASVVEIVIFSLALSGKVKKLVKEKEALQEFTTRKLEEKVLERTYELQVRTKELEERNHQLDVFVYKASHDIKGPLKSLIGLASLAMKETKDKKSLEYFDYILNTSTRLNDMVNAMLQMGRIKDIELTITEVNIRKMMYDIVHSLKHLPNMGRIKIDIKMPDFIMIQSDEILLYSVFQNLIENAIKYSDYHKEYPYLEILVKEVGDKIRIDFSDNGLGIPEARRERVFDMFYKVQNSSSGSGLGLYLTKLTLEKLGGTISLTSQEGEGSTFTVYLKK